MERSGHGEKFFDKCKWIAFLFICILRLLWERCLGNMCLCLLLFSGANTSKRRDIVKILLPSANSGEVGDGKTGLFFLGETRQRADSKY